VQNYEDFVAGKRRAEVGTGHQPGELNPHLFDFQHAIVSWAVRRGRAAIFADTGLGKTLMQLSWADEVASHTNGAVLILAPLAVSEQTITVAHLMRLASGSRTTSAWMPSTSAACTGLCWTNQAFSRRTMARLARASLSLRRASRTA
jgi:hypothetical protein